jgi:adenylylsulfate kinase
MLRGRPKALLMESLLIITGSMGVGKTTVLGEASDILALHHMSHGAIDLDAFGAGYFPSLANHNLIMFRNLHSVCENYAALEVKRLLLARGIENRAELELCCGIVSAKKTAVCRLVASLETMEQRIGIRESGIAHRDYIARVAELNALLDRARLENFSVETENRSITDIAEEMLIEAGWISKLA